MTLGELINAGATRFANAQLALGQGTLEYRDEARWLALSAIGLAVDSPDSVEHTALNADQAAAIEVFFTRRLHERIPAAYITGTAWLKGYAFHVDSRVIIPRSFIAELLLEKLFPFVQHEDRVFKVLDLCTGSGCLAIIAAHQFPNAQVIASDISAPALEVANQNIAAHELTERVQVLQSDLYQSLDPNERFDVILCNPPYVPKWKAATMPQEFCHEPEMALYADDAGMALVREVIAGAAQRLEPQGVLAVEIGHEFEACNTLFDQRFRGVVPTWIESGEQIDNVFIVSREELLNTTRSPTP
jgi:ribosomal protein L3 glutamine methyltransferase